MGLRPARLSKNVVLTLLPNPKLPNPEPQHHTLNPQRLVGEGVHQARVKCVGTGSFCTNDLIDRQLKGTEDKSKDAKSDCLA